MELPFFNALKNNLKSNSKDIAFVIDDKEYSYQYFHQIVVKISHELAQLKQQKIVVSTNNDIETYASIIAIWLTGNIYIPINFENNTERLAIQLRAIKADVILSSVTIDNIESINTSSLKATQEDLPLSNVQQNDTAYILFTSGTTGKPKGIPISYHNLNAFADSFLNMGYTFSKSDNFLQMADLTFDMSIISFLIPLCVGATVTTINTSEIKYLAALKTLMEKDITVLITAPSTLQLLKPYYPEINLECLKYTFVGAEAFYQETAVSWNKCAPNSKIINLYGPSESGIYSAFHEWNSSKNETHNGIVSIGRNTKNVELVLVDSENNTITNNDEGEALIAGNQVFKSYLNPNINDKNFTPIIINDKIKTFYRTGDILFKDENGNLFYCGRKDHQVKIQGKRVELQEIEFHTKKLSHMFNSVAMCYEGLFGSNHIALFVDFKIDQNELLNLLKQNLPDYMIPSKIIQVDQLPLNKNQKVDTTALRNLIGRD